MHNRRSVALVPSRSEWCSDSARSLKFSSISPCKMAIMSQLQSFSVSISSMVTTWIQLPGLRTWLKSTWKVSKPVPTPSMSWRNPMFLTEKSEENRQLERFHGNISLVKVVQNDQQCYPECLETPSGWLQCRYRSGTPLPDVPDGENRGEQTVWVVLRQYFCSKSWSEWSVMVSWRCGDSIRMTPVSSSIVTPCSWRPKPKCHFGDKSWKQRLFRIIIGTH